ncbi:MAG: glycosyltransferase family 4 protein [Halanaerobiales bacterium]|nr:glycosyltransferase family 4 protein [Halanaerobiales bacterium]
MKKILYIIPYLSIGGTEKHVLDLITGFEDKYELFLLAPPGKTSDQFTARKVKYYPFPRLDQKLISGLKTFFAQLKKILKENTIDLIHIHGAPELIILVKMINRKIPILFTVHGFHGPRKSWDYLGCAKVCNRFASKVITVAKVEEEILIKKRIQPKIIQTIHNGVPDPKKLELKKPSDLNKISGKLIIGAIARFETTKGINFLIDAYSSIQEKYPSLHLVIVGSGSKETELKNQVNQLNLNDKITFTGYQKNVHDYLHIYDIFVIPSLHEAHPLVLMEGMGHDKPIIATEVGGIPEVIEDGKNGLLVPPSNSNALAKAIQKLLDDPILRKNIGEKARETYNKEFAVERMLEETEKVYLSLFS